MAVAGPEVRIELADPISVVVVAEEGSGIEARSAEPEVQLLLEPAPAVWQVSEEWDWPSRGSLQELWAAGLPEEEQDQFGQVVLQQLYHFLHFLLVHQMSGGF